MTPPSSDVDLMARVATGDREAFEKVMRDNEDRVFAVCLRILADREAALDATQETFLTVFRKADQFRGAAAAGTWIYRIAVNVCYDLHRKAKRRHTDPLPEYVDPPDPAAEDALDSAALRPQIEQALAALPPEFRAALVLADLEGLSLPAVAEILRVPVGTVKSRLFRGRRLLANALGNRRP